VLAANGIVWAESEAWQIVESATGRKRAELVAAAEEIAPTTEARAVELTRMRATGRPLQYVIGTVGFRYLDLYVGPGVFIPRPETETVAATAMQKLPEAGTLVDVGTGSGAIALSVAHERRDARVLATETSADALVWAEKNRSALGLDVELIHCDLMSGLPPELRSGVDVVVTNPPYVPPGERHSLPADVIDHEPHDALFATEEGRGVIDRVARQGLMWLRPGGWMVLEIGHGQARAVKSLLRSIGYHAVSVSMDPSERERVAEARRP
jgi:release factor glutamine methyltransferase